MQSSYAGIPADHTAVGPRRRLLCRSQHFSCFQHRASGYTHGPAGFVADDPVVRAIVRQVETAAARKMPILIRGETGTGKEQLARRAHIASGRTGAFVPVNCAALPESLIEAELFGYAEGAFTGARRGGAIGLVKEAAFSDGKAQVALTLTTNDPKIPLQLKTEVERVLKAVPGVRSVEVSLAVQPVKAARFSPSR